MTSMVEHVARALWEETLPEEKWEATPEPLLRQWRRAARAAIEAMREPTEAMVNAGYDATRLSDGTPQFADAGFCLGHAWGIFSAMISASLLPPQSEE